jgi:hypothetical protein
MGCPRFVFSQVPEQPRSLLAATGGELGFTALLDEVAQICRQHRVSRVAVDQLCSVPVREHLRRRGLSPHELTMTAKSKFQIYSALKAHVYQRTLELHRHEGLLSELARLEAHYVGETVSIRVPRVARAHGDMAASLVAAVACLPQHGDMTLDLDDDDEFFERAGWGEPSSSAGRLRPGMSF